MHIVNQRFSRRQIMKSRTRRVAIAGALIASTLTPFVHATPAQAASTACSASAARKAQLRFNYKSGSIQICAKRGSSYRWRTATPAEAQRPYLGYLRPLPTSTYLDVSPKLSGQLVRQFSDLFTDQDVSALFAGFVAVGVKSSASSNEYDSVAIIFPYSRLGRAAIGGTDPAELNDGSVVTLAGRPVGFESDGSTSYFTYIGQTAIVQFIGDANDGVFAPNIVTEWLNAHGNV
jgi:hypothetical protein